MTTALKGLTFIMKLHRLKWMVFFILLTSNTLAASPSNVCVKVKCRTKVSSGMIQALSPFISILNIGEKISVTMTPVHLSYGTYIKAGAKSVFDLTLDSIYSPVSYTVSDVERKGSSLFAGFGFGWQALFTPKSWIHNFYIKSTFFPYSNFSVKSTTSTQIVSQNQALNLTTQTVVTYSGSLGVKLESGFVRYLSNPLSSKSNLFLGLGSGLLQQNFKTKTEQSLQRLEGEEASVKSPVQSPISFSYQMVFFTILLGMDI